MTRVYQMPHRGCEQDKEVTCRKAIKHSFYVDDSLCGANSLEEAIQLVNDLRQELLEYGFRQKVILK